GGGGCRRADPPGCAAANRIAPPTVGRPVADRFADSSPSVLPKPTPPRGSTPPLVLASPRGSTPAFVLASPRGSTPALVLASPRRPSARKTGAAPLRPRRAAAGPPSALPPRAIPAL